MTRRPTRSSPSVAICNEFVMARWAGFRLKGRAGPADVSDVHATEGPAVAAADPGLRGQRVVVCDDDPVVRSVVSGLVAAEGGEVIAEADTAVEAMLLVDRFRPDVVVLDLNLRAGSGTQVLDAIISRPDRPRVVVFTAYDQIAPHPGDRIDVAYKPDFEGLTRCLRSLDDRPVERRRPTRTLPGAHRPMLDDATAFYRVLGDALPDDVLVSVERRGDGDELADLLRRLVRAQDRVHQRSADVLLLLVGGGPDAVVALRGRVGDQVADLDARLRSVDVGDDPIGAFDRLTR